MDNEKIQNLFNRLEEAGLFGALELTLDHHEMNLVYKMILELKETNENME